MSDSDIFRSWPTEHGDTVEVYETEDREFRWRVQARNGEIVGSGESHTSPWTAIEAATRHHPPMPVTSEE